MWRLTVLIRSTFNFWGLRPPSLKDQKMDYYKQPTEHPRAAEMEQLQEELEKWMKKRHELEVKDREFNDDMERAYAIVDKTIQDIDALLEAIYWERT
jgi:hypothetical protein